MKLCLAILWTIALIIDIISAATGHEPTWVMVFAPLSILVLQRWTDWTNERSDKRQNRKPPHDLDW